MSESGPAANVASPPRGRFVAAQALLCCLSAPLLGVAAARAAVWAEHVRAPLLIFPLLVGCCVGLALVALMRLANIGHRPTLMVGAALAVLSAIVGQHYFSYRDYLVDRATFLAQQRDGTIFAALQDKLPAAAPSFAEYMCGQARVGRPLLDVKGTTLSLRGPAAWTSWAVDGLITLASAVTIVYLFARCPYCNACRSWYRTVRSGRLIGDTVLRVVDPTALPLNQPIAAARYRLSHCASGCAAARLELMWETAQGRMRRGEAWLDAAQREKVVRALDEEM